MELGAIRSQFIQHHLRHALNSHENHVAREFRRYFDWFADSIPETEREFILRQLLSLEEVCPTNPRLRDTALTALCLGMYSDNERRARFRTIPRGSIIFVKNDLPDFGVVEIEWNDERISVFRRDIAERAEEF